MILLLGCSHPVDLPELPGEGGETVRIVLLGDTGAPSPELDAVLSAVRAEPKDLVVALGDLVYWAPPPCPPVLPAETAALFDARVGPLAGLGAPTLLVMGNHDVGNPIFSFWKAPAPRRERCFTAYAASRPDLRFPGSSYLYRAGDVLVAVVATTNLDADLGRAVSGAFTAHAGPKLLFGHHGLVIHQDKEHEDLVRPWLARHGIRPDLYANGHAHLLQFGVYDGIPAVTSGATSKLRDRPACPGECGEGELWGRSVPGYAVVEAGDGTLKLEMHGADGGVLYTWP